LARAYAVKLQTVVVLLITLAGCSKPMIGNGSSQAVAPGGASVAVASASPPAGSACDRKLLTATDVSAILKGTVTVGPLPGDPQSCIFRSNDETFDLTVSLRPGQGDLTVKTVLAGGENVSATPLTGVGDRAAWTPMLHEVNATKNNLLCDIQAPGNNSATQQTLGALCNKIFAAS
jgi:hypothetical protein